MKRVLVVITTAFTKTGGLASVMLNYWRALDKTGFTFDFASTNVIEDSLYREISKEGCNYYQLPSRNNLIAYVSSLIKICKGYDIIHVHANSATSIIELIAAKIAGIPKRIHHNHNSRSKYPVLNKILLPLLRYTYTDAVACSTASGEWIFGKNNYVILPNAINIDRFMFDCSVRDRIRKEFCILENEFVIGHIGKFTDAKNHEFLIKVFASYHQKHSNSKLLLVGNGPWYQKIINWVKESGCADAIILAGLRSDVSSIIQAFDIFVFPSIYEGLPLSVLEAQASGLPCLISSNVSSSVKIGTDSILKDLSDGIENWAEAIDKFDYTISRRDRCTQNYELITKSHFNIKEEANELMKIYKKKYG